MTDLPTGPEIQRLVLAAIEDLGGQAHRRAITERAVQLGDFTPEQLAVPPPPKNRGRFPNKIEFQISFALSHLKRKGELTDVGSGEWRRLP